MTHANTSGKSGIAYRLLGVAVFGFAANVAAAESEPPTGACPPDTIVSAARALQFGGDADFWQQDLHAACRLDPDEPRHAIVALTYFAGQERSGTARRYVAGFARDLDVLVLDLGAGAVLAHRHDAEAIDDGGEALTALSIDTGRYWLAKAQRAFGVRVSNATDCQCANIGRTNLTLYLRNGGRLDALLSIDVATRQEGHQEGTPQPPACAAYTAESSTVLSLGRGASHGLADLQLLETVERSYDFDEDRANCPVMPASHRARTLRYDGGVYR